jgi:hypothetical protein
VIHFFKYFSSLKNWMPPINQLDASYFFNCFSNLKNWMPPAQTTGCQLKELDATSSIN